MGSLLRCAVLAGLLCTACSLPPEQRSELLRSSSHGSPPEFRAAPCAFEPPAGSKVRCGWLTVPEDRTKAGGRTIRLHVAIYSSRSQEPGPDPILWLAGGPGGRANRLASTLFGRVVQPYIANREFIVMDVRGTGNSQPALDCPTPSGPPARWLAECRARLSRVADLSCYNSAAVAADLADLRRALRLHEWNLMGESYGTRLALTAMRDQPEGIRSVVLDSVVAPEADQYADGPEKFEQAMGALFSGCAEDAACRAAFPDLRTTLLSSAEQLDRSPRRLTGVWHGTPFEFQLDGRQLLEALHMAFYESDLIPEIPKAIHHAVDGGGDFIWSEAIARHTIFVSRDLVDQGAHLSFHCAEEVPFTDRNRLIAEDGKRPWMRHVASGLPIVDTCRLWAVKSGDAREALPVTSNIPTLVLAGEYDPVTPPSYARSVASHLSRSHLFVLPRLGHWLTGVETDACPQELVREFLANPDRKPESSCLQRLKAHWETR